MKPVIVSPVWTYLSLRALQGRGNLLNNVQSVPHETRLLRRTDALLAMTYQFMNHSSNLWRKAQKRHKSNLFLCISNC